MCHRHTCNMDCFIRSVDDDDPITQHQRPGVAIAFKRDMSKLCTSIPDGTCAVQPINIQAAPRDLCIINVYLPCRGNHSESEFSSARDAIQVIMEKCSATHYIILAGDMNASLLENRCGRDKKFSKWCKQQNIPISDNYPHVPTHVHHRGSGHQWYIN